ncbi:hypothetical protein LY78DRAFT_330162 [Colletotrichum sublineola]|nr:hypothetical protein LY78DRAFT_330162 [Colletotrichum sublineola]
MTLFHDLVSNILSRSNSQPYSWLIVTHSTVPASSNLESIRVIGCLLPCLPYRSPGTQARPITCCEPPQQVSSQLLELVPLPES